MAEMKCRQCGEKLTISDDQWNDDENADGHCFNSVYGCDTGCEYVRFELECPHCGDSFETGQFGYFDTPEELEEILLDFREEYDRSS